MKYESAEPEFDPGEVVWVNLGDCGRVGPGLITSVRYNDERCFYDIRFVPRREGSHPIIISNVDETCVERHEEPIEAENGWAISGGRVNVLIPDGEPRARRVPVLPLGESVWAVYGVEALNDDSLPIQPHGSDDGEPWWLLDRLPPEWVVDEDEARPPDGFNDDPEEEEA